MDIEEYKHFCGTEKLCPYYLSRQASRHLPIVLCPYNYLVSASDGNTAQSAPGTPQQTVKIQIEGNIIVFDEAHNVPAACCEEYDSTFGLEDLRQNQIKTEYILRKVLEEKALYKQR